MSQCTRVQLPSLDAGHQQDQLGQPPENTEPGAPSDYGVPLDVVSDARLLPLAWYAFQADWSIISRLSLASLLKMDVTLADLQSSEMLPDCSDLLNMMARASDIASRSASGTSARSVLVWG